MSAIDKPLFRGADVRNPHAATFDAARSRFIKAVIDQLGSISANHMSSMASAIRDGAALPHIFGIRLVQIAERLEVAFVAWAEAGASGMEITTERKTTARVVKQLARLHRNMPPGWL